VAISGRKAAATRPDHEAGEDAGPLADMETPTRARVAVSSLIFVKFV